VKYSKVGAVSCVLAVLVLSGWKIFQNLSSRNADSIPSLRSNVKSSLTLPPEAAIAPGVVTTNKKQNATALKNHPALVEFEGWAKGYLGQKNQDVSSGERLALNRRNVMLHLIKTDPETALAQTVPARWRKDLPEAITQHFEERVDGRGSFDVMVATDFEKNVKRTLRDVRIGGTSYSAFVYGRRTRQMTQSSIPLHGIAIDGKLAMLIRFVCWNPKKSQPRKKRKKSAAFRRSLQSIAINR